MRLNSYLGVLRQWLARNQLPVVGAWVTQWAADGLIFGGGRSGVEAAVRLVCEGVKHQGRIVRQLARLRDQDAIDVVCRVWCEGRDSKVGQLLVDRRWIAARPADLRVLTALKVNRVGEVFQAGAGERTQDPGSRIAILTSICRAAGDEDDEMAERAEKALEGLRFPSDVDVVCSVYSETRNSRLAQVIRRSEHVASAPARVRVLSALVSGKRGVLIDGGSEVAEELLRASHDSEFEVAKDAAASLQELNSPEARDWLCQTIIERDEPAARRAVLAGGYAPSDARTRSIFYFLTEQWEKFHQLDFDLRLLADAYEAGDRKLRGKIAEVARRAGRTEWISIFGGGRQDRRISEMSEAEWDAIVTVLGCGERWPDMWRLAQAAPPDWSVPLLRRLADADWRPENRHEAEAMNQLLELAGRCSEEPPFLGRLMGPGRVLPGATGSVLSLVIRTDGRALAAGGRDGRLWLWDLSNEASEPRMLSGHTDWITSLAMSPDDRWIVSGSSDKSIRIWDGAEGEEKAVLRGHAGAIRGLALGLDGRILASASDDGSARLWSMPGGELLAVLGGHTDQVSCVAISPNGEWAATGSYDSDIRIWHLPEGKLVTVLSAHRALVHCLVFSPDSASLISGSKDKAAILWEMPGGMQWQRLRGHRDDIVAVAVSSDGRWLATGSWDATVRLWNLPDGRLQETFGALTSGEGHGGWVTALGFSPDGRVLASGSLDNTCRLWSVPGGAPLKVLEGHDGRISCLAFSKDGKALATGSWDGTVRLWSSELARLRRIAVGKMKSGDYDWVEKVLQNSALSASERAWLEFTHALMRWRRRYDIQIDLPRISVGEFDIQIEVN